LRLAYFGKISPYWIRYEGCSICRKKRVKRPLVVSKNIGWFGDLNVKWEQSTLHGIAFTLTPLVFTLETFLLETFDSDKWHYQNNDGDSVMDHVSDSTVSFIYEVLTSCVIEENKSIIYWMSGWTWQPLSSLPHPQHVMIEFSVGFE